MMKFYLSLAMGLWTLMAYSQTIPVSSFSLATDHYQIRVGDITTFSVKIMPHNASVRTLTVESTQPSIAAVTPNDPSKGIRAENSYQITARAVGTTQIVIRSQTHPKVEETILVDVVQEYTRGGSYLLPGVSIAGGWFDVNKEWVENVYSDDPNEPRRISGGDTVLCWAASLSNLIDYWQGGFPQNALPSGIPYGPRLDDQGNPRPTGNTSKGQSNVFLYIRELSMNNGISFPSTALNWYFTYTDVRDVPLYLLADGSTPGGGWFREAWGARRVAADDRFNTEYYLEAEDTWIGIERGESIKRLKETLHRYIVEKKWPVNLNYSGHAVTLWGYELGNQEVTETPTTADYELNATHLATKHGDAMVTHVYLTDSDDNRDTPYFGTSLMRVPVKYIEDFNNRYAETDGIYILKRPTTMERLISLVPLQLERGKLLK